MDASAPPGFAAMKCEETKRAGRPWRWPGIQVRRGLRHPSAAGMLAHRDRSSFRRDRNCCGSWSNAAIRIKKSRNQTTRLKISSDESLTLADAPKARLHRAHASSRSKPMVLMQSRKLLAGSAAAAVMIAVGLAYGQQAPRGKTSYLPVGITEPFSAVFARLSAQKPAVPQVLIALA